MEINILLVTSRSVSFQLETHENFFLNEKVILNNSGNLEEVDVVDLEKLDEEIKKYQQL